MVAIKAKKLLIVSAIIATFIFSTGLFLGYALDGFRENEILSNIKQNELDTESFILEQQFLDELGGDKCEILSERALTLQPTLTEIGRQLGRWQNSDFKQDEFNYLKRKYFLTEIRFLMLIETLKQNCNSDYNVIVFFYKIDDDTSKRQGYVLDEITNQNQNVIVLSIDKDYTQEPLIDILKSNYDVIEAPSLVINGDTVSGFIPEEDLIELLD